MNGMWTSAWYRDVMPGKAVGRPFFIMREYVCVRYIVEGYVEPPSIGELVEREVFRRGLQDKCNAYTLCNKPICEHSWLREHPNTSRLVTPAVRCPNFVDLTYAVQLYKLEEDEFFARSALS